MRNCREIYEKMLHKKKIKKKESSLSRNDILMLKENPLVYTIWMKS